VKKSKPAPASTPPASIKRSKKIAPTEKRRRAPLKRTEDTYEFLVTYPHGGSAISGYRRAARHFGLHTREDPTYEGSDAYRVLVHESAQKLRDVAKALNDAYSAANSSDLGDETLIDEVEDWLVLKSDVAWFTHDWSYWGQDQDEGALEHLKWKRTVVESGKDYRVTLRIAGKRALRLARAK
jgi:hypothetical protein